MSETAGRGVWHPRPNQPARIDGMSCGTLPVVNCCRFRYLFADIGRQCSAVYRPCVLACGAPDGHHGRARDLQSHSVASAVGT
jgi:hypothetical protein